MANTYTWDCKTVDTYPTHESLNDVIYNVHWRLTATDSTEEHSTTSIGTQTISTDSIDADSFVAVADLTNAQVTAWVEAEMGADCVAEIKASLDSALTELATPTSVTMQIGGDE